MAPPPIIFGELGLTKVVYSGSMRGTWTGHCTGQKYPFAPDAAVRWVDKRDLEAMLAFKGADGQDFFGVG